MKPDDRTWTIQEAQEALDDVLDAASGGHPQRVAKSDGRAVVIVSEKDWLLMTERSSSEAEDKA